VGPFSSCFGPGKEGGDIGKDLRPFFLNFSLSMPPRKRSRTNDKRKEDLYFAHGSVVLSAKDDMLTMPTPANQDSYDDLPLVHLHDDAKCLKEFLGMLYQMENLRNTFIQKLQMGWPTTLIEWDALGKDCTLYFAGVIGDDHYSGIVSIINLANDCDVSSVRPTAFY
jgi:hypothetical protein